MDTQEYQEQIALANEAKSNKEYGKAEAFYLKAMDIAPADEIQMLLDSIEEMRSAASQITKMDTIETPKPMVQGFTFHHITFEDVIGYKVQKRVVRRIMELPLRKGEDYSNMNMAKSTGIIFYGPPGTGKTFLAKGISGELNIPMKSIFVSDVLDKLVGGSEKNMRKLFEDAKAMQPCILFFDELDALGSSREAANEFTSNDIKNTINEFLMQLSELHDNKEDVIFIIGATNLPWLLDSAIKRSGRLEHHIFIGPPGFGDRKQLIRYYLKVGDRYQLKLDMNILSLAMIRYSPADIEKVCTAVKRRIIESGKRIITTRDVQRVLKDKVEGGSSMDDWTLKARDTYLKKSKYVIHRTGFLGWRKTKERIEEQGNLTDAELKTYKPLVNYVKRTMRWWSLSNLIRFIAKGI